MKTKFVHITLLIAFFSSNLLVSGQGVLSELDTPVTGDIIIDLDMERYAEEDYSIRQERGIAPIGRVIPFTISTDEFLIDKSTSKELEISCAGAGALNLYFKELTLMNKDELIISSADDFGKRIVLRSEDVHNRSKFSIPPLPGSLLRIELVTSGNTDEMSSFEIDGIGVLYHGFDQTNRGGGSCQIDVACSEADNWQPQKDAVVRLIINDGGVQFACSGALMNNTLGDQRRLVLSALHCLGDVSDEELETAVVTFNYERSDCNFGTAPETNFLVGVVRLADSNDEVEGQANPSGSDFALIEILDPIPSEWNPYWAGWSSLNAASSSGVSIHHPAGGAKRISTYNSTTISTFLGAPGSHWGVTWIATDNGHGVTEPGSSGSPLFNSNGLVMGTLTGGFSACEENGNNGPNEPDYYGKLSYHWLNNPNSADQKLKLFLDPLNTGMSSLEGSYNPIMSVYEESLADLRVFPNPCNEILQFEFPLLEPASNYKIINQLGEELQHGNLAPGQKNLDVSNLGSGLYYLIFMKDFSFNHSVRFVKK